MKPILFRILISLATTLFFVLFAHAADAPPMLANTPAANDVHMVDSDAVADIYTDQADASVVHIATKLLSEDVERVTGRKPAVKQDETSLSKTAIIVGTIGHCAAIDKLIDTGKLDVSRVRGQWESFMLATIEKPLPNVDHALVIVGSDRRGTAYGVFELSEQIGVSPWYWWADSTPQKRDSLAIKAGVYVVGPPSVKYRGIFINDEDWGLNPWASKTFDPKFGNIGPKTYEKVFELMLRLKANYLWPAMHAASMEFGKVDENIKLADQWAIVMGASHAEPMNRNNIDWLNLHVGDFRYDTNRDVIHQFWEDWAKKRGPYDAVWTVGLRGISDGAMRGPKTVDDKVKLLEQAITDQRALLAKYVNPKVEKVPQAFMPYKEALDQYQHGLKLPDDITLVWCDDNYGYIRQFSTPDEQKRSGHAGVYYHSSYFGRPKSYLWIDSTTPTLISAQMKMAYAYGADRIWVLNVGDIKSNEKAMEFWTKLAWNVNRYDHDPQIEFLKEWAAREFGKDLANDIADLLNKYYQLGFQRKPELMDAESFSLSYYSEAENRLASYQTLCKRAEEIQSRIPPSKKDAYYELVLYSVRIATAINEAFLGASLNHFYAQQGVLLANDYAKSSDEAIKQTERETDYYNNELAGGRWKGIMTLKGITFTGDFARYNKAWGIQWPKTQTIAPSAQATLGIIAEGQPPTTSLTTEPGISSNSLPTFVEGDTNHHVFDVFSTSDQPFTFTTKSDSNWIKLERTEGEAKLSSRVTISIDWTKAPSDSTAEGKIIVEGLGAKREVEVRAMRPPKDASGRFVESDGCVSMEAEHFTRSDPFGDVQWKSVSQLGRDSDAMIVQPVTTPPIDPEKVATGGSPLLEYDVFLTSKGGVTVQAYCLPTHPVHSFLGVRYAVSFDNQPPKIVDFSATGGASGEAAGPWQQNVTRNIAVSTSQHTIAQPGRHTLKFWMVDPGVVLDKLVIYAGGVHPSELGPPESVKVGN
ncbi:MAG TPA: glycosyl hydrolase 115 family protein [Tepidisphaeraceae bacterium]|nr:glycosyl hydrolase 115 family protein [Tepidisphaeraceae bacterium]